MITKFKNILIFLLGVLLLFFIGKSCNKKSYSDTFNTPVKIIHKSTIVDSLLVVVDSLTVQVDSLYRIENITPLIVEIPQIVDTGFIIQQHYSRIKNTIKHRDSNLDFKLKFELYKNQVIHPKLEYKILKPTTYFEIKPPPKNHFYIGVTVGGSKVELQQFTPEILFFRGRHGFKLGYNLLDKNRNIYIGYYFKIK